MNISDLGRIAPVLSNNASVIRNFAPNFLRLVYRQFYYRRPVRDRAGMFGILHARLKYDCYISLRSEIQHIGKIEFGRNSRIFPNAILNFKSDFNYFEKNIKIGENTSIMPGAKIIPQRGFVFIGSNCTISYNALLYGTGGLTIGDHTRIGANSVIVPMSHTYLDPSLPIWKQPESQKGIRIGSDVWIGVNSVILEGIEIGDGAIIGAGSVVNSKVESYSIVAGVPAKFRKWRFAETAIPRPTGSKSRRKTSF